MTSFAYDSLGRVTQVTFPTTLTESYTYDADGNLLSKKDRNGQTINYTYDALNRLVTKSYPDSTAVSYTYDNLSRPTQVTDPTGTYSFTYDNMVRLASATDSYSFLGGANEAVGYTYDAASNRLSMTSPQGGVTHYVHDTLNRLTSLTDPQSNQFTFAYDALSRRTSLARPNGVTTAYGYDALSHLLSILHQAGNTSIDGTEYTYDSFGNVTASTGSVTNPFQFTAREFDSETGLYYYRARYYDPIIGRFLSEDPAGLFSGSENFYQYVGNDPLLYIDPFGLKCTCVYHQSSGAIRCTNDLTGKPVVNAFGYSGLGRGLNKPTAQDVRDIGPIPQGTYAIASRPNHEKGPLTFRLTPLPGTNTLGRSGFLIHGDNSLMNHTASHGCIVLGPTDRRPIAGCDGGRLQVVP